MRIRIQHSGNFVEQFIGAKRFRDTFQSPVIAAGVSGHKENWQAVIHAQNAISQFKAINVRHDYVGEEKHYP